MYEVRKTIEIAGAHCLELNYPSKCTNLHGHNWKITVVCRSKELNESGMVVDFTEIGRVVKELDHKNLNDYVPQPTAENIARWICEQITSCKRVEIYESEGNLAIYEAEEDPESE